MSEPATSHTPDGFGGVGEFASGAIPPPDAVDPVTGLAVWICDEADLAHLTLWDLQDLMFGLSLVASAPMLVVVRSGTVRLAETLHAAVRGMVTVRVVADAAAAADEIVAAAHGAVCAGHRGAYFTEFAAAAAAAAELALTTQRLNGGPAEPGGVERLMGDLRRARAEARLRR